jgi:hypothetical protein
MSRLFWHCIIMYCVYLPGLVDLKLVSPRPSDPRENSLSLDWSATGLAFSPGEVAAATRDVIFPFSLDSS